MRDIADRAFQASDRTAGADQALPGDESAVMREAQSIRMGQDRARVGQPVAEGVLDGADLQWRWQPRQY